MTVTPTIVKFLAKLFRKTPQQPPLTQEQEAERNWTRHNEEARKAGCFVCGKTAPHVFESHGTVGRVPYQSFTCDEHRGATGWRSYQGGERIATYDRSKPCETCTEMCGGIMDSQNWYKQTTWFCETRPDLEDPAEQDEDNDDD